MMAGSTTTITHASGIVTEDNAYTGQLPLAVPAC